MPSRIEDYALIGDCQTAALVGRDGSIDWLCVPRFDSGACFAALVGTRDHGRWLIAPAAEVRRVRRRYRGESLVLETDFETSDGAVTVIDCMPPRERTPDIVRIVQGRSGRVRMRMELAVRFDYGSIVPWVRAEAGGIRAIAGPDMLHVHAGVPMRGENLKTVADFEIAEGERVPFVLSWHRSYETASRELDPEEAVRYTEEWWHEWARQCTYDGDWRDAVVRSLITLKGLTYAPTGGIVAAPTTSLPELVGGVRNWDYRYCWVRDATFTLYALLVAGFKKEAAAWREWLLRAVAGSPSELQILYGITGNRRLPEQQLTWLPGYEDSQPVRIGNAAAEQFQLDVYGELIDMLYHCRQAGLDPHPAAWRIERALLDFLESNWERADEGIWEVRGPRRHFTHSKVMAWVAVDRGVKSIERFGLDGPLDRWRALRRAIHEQVCREGFDGELGSFVQYYGAKRLDASLLMMPLVGFLPITDARVRGTVEAIERHLMTDGLVARYLTEEHIDGLPPGEGAFLACSFWLADCLVLLGRRTDARQLFERLLDLRNDVGLLSEQYDPVSRRMLGNFPQAFSHVALVNTARNLTRGGGPAEDRERS